MTGLLLTLVSAVIGAENLNPHLYPSSANMIATVDLNAVRRSGFFNEDLQRGFEQAINANEQVQRLARLLSFDPVKDLATFTICASGQGRDAQALMIVNGQFPYEKLTTALKDMAKKGELTELSFNDLPIYFNHRARQAVYFAVIDGGTAIASSSKKLLEDAIQGLTDLRQPKPELQERLTWKDEGTPAVRLAGVFPEEARRQMERVPQFGAFAKDLVGYNMIFQFGEPNHFEARLTLKETAAAKQAATTFKMLLQLGKVALQNSGQRPDMLEMLTNLRVEDKDRDLYFGVDIPGETMKTMVTLNRKERERFEEQRRRRLQEKQKSEKKADN